MSYKLFNLKQLSTYRNSLMGLAMIWVVVYHFGFQLPGLSHVAGIGFTGVDIFVFLSGFGLFFSLNKGLQLGRYYKKRLFRILPTYALVGIFLSIFCYDDNLLTYIWRCTTLGYWSNGIYYEWFIPSILCLYALYPLIFKVFFQSGRIKLCFAFIGILFVVILYNCYNQTVIDTWHFLLLYRVPIFILGSLSAYWLCRGITVKYFINIALCSFFVFVLFFLIKDLRFRYLSFTFAAPLIICALSILCNKNIMYVNRWGGVIGSSSLEIYLIHLIFLKYMRINNLFPVDFSQDLSTIILTLFSIVFGISLHKVLKKCNL